MLSVFIGITGMFLLLFAFIMNQLNRWKVDDFVYDLINTIGSLIMVCYAFMINSYPFLVLNAVWAFFSLKDVINYIRKK